MNRKSLFRREALEHEQEKRAAEALVISPLSFKFLAAFTAFMIVAFGGWLYWGTYTETESVTGYIIPSKGLVSINSSQRGVVTARYVHLGQRVKKGERLYRISTVHSTQGMEDVNAALIDKFEAQRKQINQQIKFTTTIKNIEQDKLKRQKSDLKAEISSLRKQLKTERLLRTLADENLSRYNKGVKIGVMSKTSLFNAQQQALNQEATVERLEKSETELKAQQHQIPRNILQAKVNGDNKVAKLKNELMELERQQLQLQESQDIIIRAPVPGTVSLVVAKVGQTVTTQTPLVNILPQGSVFQARLLVPTRAIGFVRPGQQVRLRYDAFSYELFGLYKGRILDVSRSIMAPSEINLPVKERSPYYMVRASLKRSYVIAHGRRMPLASGMTLSADIVLYRERLYQWLLRPLSSLRGGE